MSYTIETRLDDPRYTGGETNVLGGRGLGWKKLYGQAVPDEILHLGVKRAGYLTFARRQDAEEAIRILRRGLPRTSFHYNPAWQDAEYRVVTYRAKAGRDHASAPRRFVVVVKAHKLDSGAKLANQYAAGTTLAAARKEADFWARNTPMAEIEIHVIENGKQRRLETTYGPRRDVAQRSPAARRAQRSPAARRDPARSKARTPPRRETPSSRPSRAPTRGTYAAWRHEVLLELRRRGLTLEKVKRALRSSEDGPTATVPTTRELWRGGEPPADFVANEWYQGRRSKRPAKPTARRPSRLVKGH